MTHPSKQAMEAARKVCIATAAAHAGGYCEHCGTISAALDAYAAERSKASSGIAAGLVERCHRVERERDAALARAETAEAESARWKAQFESTNAAGISAVEKLAIAEERVQALEALLTRIGLLIERHDHQT